MKKQLLATLMLASAVTANAQVKNDTVTLGAGYVNQVWYSLANDEKGTQPRANWDLAFNLKDITSPVFVNTNFSHMGSLGVTLWNYPKDDTSAWSSIDTAGLSTWEPRHNSDTSWALGAMGNYIDPGNSNDVDWGVYDPATHYIHGDSIYIIKLNNGAYKKLWMKHLKSGTFTFTYADLDGSNEQTAAIKKSDYAGKNFAYYSIENNMPLNREPLAADWDLTFTQYVSFIPAGPGVVMPYTVTGVLHNRGVSVAEVGNLPNKTTYNSYNAHPYATAINTIGSDWKSNSGVVKDSLVYFVKAVDETIWKMIFTGFESGVSGLGKIIFSKEIMQSTSIRNAEGKATATVSVYPNPAAASQPTTIVYNFETANTNAKLAVYDMAGRVAYTTALDNNAGLHTVQLPSNTLQAGMYIINISTDNGNVQQRMIIK